MRKLGLVTLAALALAACGLPRDPGGTLERVEGGVLRAGISHNPPWTAVDGDAPSGIEVELAEAFARDIDARLEWTVGGEESLLTDLEEGRLDLVVGGLTARSPWAGRVAVTRPYATVMGEDHVMAVHPGENGFLVRLERFLTGRPVLEPRLNKSGTT